MAAAAAGHRRAPGAARPAGRRRSASPNGRWPRPIAERTGTRVGADVYPTLLAGVAGAAMRTALHRWLATDFTASLPDLVDEAWDAARTPACRPRADHRSDRPSAPPAPRTRGTDVRPRRSPCTPRPPTPPRRRSS